MTFGSRSMPPWEDILLEQTWRKNNKRHKNNRAVGPNETRGSWTTSSEDTRQPFHAHFHPLLCALFMSGAYLTWPPEVVSDASRRVQRTLEAQYSRKQVKTSTILPKSKRGEFVSSYLLFNSDNGE